MSVLVKFGAEWCLPCQKMEPILAQLAEKEPDLLVVDVDVDEFDADRKTWEVDSVPVFFYIDEETSTYRRHNGALPPVKMMEFVS